MRAAEEHLRAARLFAHIIDIGPHPIAVAKGLPRDQLITPQQRLGAADLHQQIAVFGPLDYAVDDLAHAVLELVILLLALIFAHALHNHLLGGLCGNPPEIDRRQRIDEMPAQLDIGLELAGDMQRNLRLLVLHHLDRLGVAAQAHIAGLAVDGGTNILLMPVFGAAGLLDGLLHGFEHLVTVDRFFARDGVGNEKKFGAGDGRVHGKSLVGLFGGGEINQSIRQHQLGATNISKRQFMLQLALTQASHGGVRREDHPGHPLAAIDGNGELHAREMPGKPVPILHPRQRPINPGGADLQRPPAGDRVIHIHHGTDIAADPLAILNADLRTIGPIRHDLHGRPLPAQHRHPHQLIAEISDARLHNSRNSRLQSGMHRHIIGQQIALRRLVFKAVRVGAVVVI